jgi:glycosyltransferase involved in cell wall biosynthesis
MTGPLVSVVVPVYNGERYLGEALDSILAQDYDPFEVIVVDDGSDDGGAELARARDVRVLVQANGGPAAARNAGIAASRGSFVAFLDQDDLWVPGKLAKQIEMLVRRPDLGFVFAHMEIFLEPGAAWPAWAATTRPNASTPGYTPGTMMTRRELYTTLGGFDTRYRSISDAEWLLRARRAGIEDEVMPDVLLRYRIHHSNQSHDRALARSELMLALRRAPKVPA